MSKSDLERRVAALEREIELLKAAIKPAQKEQPLWWVRLAGTFKNDPVFDEIIEAGQKYRKSLRPRCS